MNDGAGGDVFAEIDALEIRDKPHYTLHTSAEATDVGATYIFKVEAYNVQGSTFSDSIGFVVGDIPSTPANAPTSDVAVTTTQKLKIDFEELADDGGSNILSYSLEIDNGRGGPFQPLFGTLSNSLSTSFTTTSVERGHVYRARYRARNAIGWGEYSPIAYLRAAVKPSAPAQAVFISASETTIEIGFFRSLNDGGAKVTSYQLFIDDGEMGDLTEVTRYDGLSTSFVIDNTEEIDLVSGKIYRITYLAVNEMGDSPYADVVSVAMSDPPVKPSPPSKIDALSSKTRMTVEWTAVSDTQLPGGAIMFYNLFIDDGNNGLFVLYSYASASLTQIQINGLKPGRAYRLKVQAINFNGAHEESDPVVLYTCTPPTHLSHPVFTGTTSTSLGLRWSEPTDNGGCPILGYSLYRDELESGDPAIEVNEDNDPLVRNIPTLRELVVALAQADLGTKYTFQLRVQNREGESLSVPVAYLFATIPTTPSSPPTILSISSSHVQAEYLFVDGTGGSPILSYHLQYMEAYNGNWIDVIGYKPATSLATVWTIGSNIIHKSTSYSLRYRVLNSKGWSGFSEEVTFLAADVPSKPELLAYSAVSSASIDLVFNHATIDDGGAPLTGYVLQMNEGTIGSDFSAVETFTN